MLNKLQLDLLKKSFVVEDNYLIKKVEHEFYNNLETVDICVGNFNTDPNFAKQMTHFMCHKTLFCAIAVVLGW